MHTGSVSVTERRAQIVCEMMHTHFNSACCSHWFLEFMTERFWLQEAKLSGCGLWKQCEHGVKVDFVKEL